MKEEFVKEYQIKDKTQEELNNILFQNILNTNNELENSINNYGFADGELIDYYLYQINYHEKTNQMCYSPCYSCRRDAVYLS